MRSCFAVLFALVVGLAGCSGESGGRSPTQILPAKSSVLTGMAQVLTLDHGEVSELEWSASAGKLFAQGGGMLFVAPPEPGSYVISAKARKSKQTLRAVVQVPALEPATLELEAEDESTFAGQRGGVRFSVEPEGKGGAHAHFDLVRSEASLALRFAQATATVDVHVVDGKHATLSFDGTELDGAGALEDEEEEALRALVASGLFPDLALIPLDVPCADSAVEPSPAALAALLFPLQLVEKYLTPQRTAQMAALASASACRYYTKWEGNADPRPAPSYPVLQNGQVVPFSFGFLPLDEEGATSLPVKSQALLPPTDSNVFGPGDSMCRGACGADCEENNCGEPEREWRCVQKDGRNTGEKQRWKRYTCGEHEGCIEHDACFDNCKAVFGVGSWESGICMRGCDTQAAMGYGAGQGIEWAQGYGPYSHERSYDYSEGEPVRDEEMCPLTFSLTAVPASGLAPFATDLVWKGDSNDPGVERCRLDLGDGSPLVDIEPCPAEGKYSHIYGVPSEMRKSGGVYTATLTRIGAAQMASTDVQARWRFDADPSSGRGPLLVGFSWDGFALVDKTLTCTLDFGDGSTPEVIDDCAKKPGVSHEYQDEGVYQAVLTVRGEDRPVKKTLSIEVTPENTPVSCSHWAEVTSWKGSAQFEYAAAAQSGAISVSVQASGNVQAKAVTVSTQSPEGISFHDTALTGTASTRELSTSSAPNAQNPLYDLQGSGEPLPPTNGTDSGSNFLFSIDLTRCRYNVHVQAMVAGTYTSGDETSASQPWVASLQTEWRPLPNSFNLSDSSSYPARTEDFILNADELVQYYWVWNQDLIGFLGEANLGSAQVSWTLERND